jgi:hypothetical protein
MAQNAGRNIYVCTDHDRHYPVGAASVVIAWNENQARVLLDEQLIAQGLKPFTKHPYTLKLIQADFSAAFILVNGDY